MKEDLPPLSRELSDLLDAERDIPDVDPAARARIRDSVEQRTLLGAPTPGAAGTSLAMRIARGWGGYVVAAAIGFAAGATWVGYGGEPERTVQRRGEARLEVPATGSEVADRPAVVGALDRARTDPAASRPAADEANRVPIPERRATEARPAPAAAPASSPGDELARERRVLDAARAAIVRGNPEEALRAISRHEERYPDGRLVEEREALAVQALAASGRDEEARDRAGVFEARFPNSLLRGAVRRAVAADRRPSL